MTPDQLNALANTPPTAPANMNLPHSPMPGMPAAGQNIDNQLQALADIHLPDPIIWWPPAPGWWIVVLASIVFVYISYRLINKKLKQSQFRKQAKIELHNIQRYWKKQQNLVLSAASLSVFIRRISLTEQELRCKQKPNQNFRSDIASLSETQWLAYLQQQPGMQKIGSDYKELLIQLPYQDPLLHFDMQEQQQLAKKMDVLLSAIAVWIKKGFKDA
ncbi:MAG: DUF4381 domain-containing protein [Pseudomonadota bacterium]